MLKRSRRDRKNTLKNLMKKDPNEPDYYSGVVSHPEPNIRKAKSRGPEEALLLIKLVDVMEFQQNYSNP